MINKYKTDYIGSKHENDFNPSFIVSATSLPTPLSRWLTYFVLLLIVITIIWACIAKVDIVATGQGKIIPNGQVKVLQSILSGKIDKIWVKENEYVQKDQILFVLENSESRIKNEQNKDALYHYKIKEWQTKLFLSVNKNKQYELSIPDFIKTKDLIFQKSYIKENLNGYHSKIDNMNHQKSIVEQEITSSSKNVYKYQELLRIKKMKLNKINELYNKKMSTEIEKLEAEETVILTDHELQMEIINEIKLNESLVSYDNEIIAIESEYKSQWLQQYEDTKLQIMSLEKEIKKLNYIIENSYIRSPISGYIQELSKFTIGGVIQSGEQLLVVVPEDMRLIGEAMIPSRDIGFVKKGMDAHLKLDAYTFTKYGLLESKLVHISTDAIEDEDMGLVYKTIYHFENPYLENMNGRQNIQTGMGLTVEIKTGERTVMEFFLSPIIKHFKESARER